MNRHLDLCYILLITISVRIFIFLERLHLSALYSFSKFCLFLRDINDKKLTIDKMIKKSLTLYLVPLVSVVVIILQVDGVKDYLKTYDQNTTEYITGFLIAAALLNHFVTSFSPLKRYENLAKNKWAAVEVTAHSLVTKYKAEYGVDLNINIMIPKHKFLYRIEPKRKGSTERKFIWIGKVFKPIWTYKNFDISKKLIITLNQGVCGKAYEKGNSVVGVEFEDNQDSDFNFNEEQKQLTRHLTIVASLAITQTEITEDGKKIKKIGVLNFESETIGAKKLILQHDLKKALEENIFWLAEICSNLM